VRWRLTLGAPKTQVLKLARTLEDVLHLEFKQLRIRVHVTPGAKDPALGILHEDAVQVPT